MRPKIQNRTKCRPNFETTPPPKQEKMDSNCCELCGRNPEEVIRSLRIKTRRRRIYAGLYIVFEENIHGKMFLEICRACFLLGKKKRGLKPALPPGAAARKRCKLPPI